MHMLRLGATSTPGICTGRRVDFWKLEEHGRVCGESAGCVPCRAELATNRSGGATARGEERVERAYTGAGRAYPPRRVRGGGCVHYIDDFIFMGTSREEVSAGK